MGAAIDHHGRDPRDPARAAPVFRGGGRGATLPQLADRRAAARSRGAHVPPYDGRVQRSLLLAGALAGVLASRGVARADGPENLGRAFGTIARVGELVVPDLRVERTLGATPATRWVLAWPLVVRGDVVALDDEHALLFTHAVELQLRAEGRAVRGLAVERAALAPGPCAGCSRWSPIVEAGAVVGEDGLGGVVGLGVGDQLRDGNGAFGALAVIARLAVTDRETRVDLSIDLLHLPWIDR